MVLRVLSIFGYVCVEMDNVHDVVVWSSATSSVVLPIKTALHFQLVHPEKNKQKNSNEQKNFCF